MKRISLLVLSGIVVASTLCSAGTAWHFKCSTEKCDLEGMLGVGGGFTFERATGYCTTCRKFVSLDWKRKEGPASKKKGSGQSSNLLRKAPPKIGIAWNAATGLSANLYPCPHCKQPFMEIDNISLIAGPISNDGVRFCPRCAKVTLRFDNRGEYD